MSDKDRKKKDGQSKDNKVMHEAAKERKEQAKATTAGDPHQMDPDVANRPGTKS